MSNAFVITPQNSDKAGRDSSTRSGVVQGLKVLRTNAEARQQAIERAVEFILSRAGTLLAENTASETDFALKVQEGARVSWESALDAMRVLEVRGQVTVDPGVGRVHVTA